MYSEFAILFACVLLAVFFRKLRQWLYGEKNSSVKLLTSGTFIWFLRSSLTKPLHEIYKQLYIEHGPLSCLTFFGWRQFYLIGKPELVKSILVENFSKLADRITLSATGDPVFDRNLIFLGHQNWRTSRKTITPVFTTKKIKLITPKILLAVQNMLQTLDDFADSGELCDVKQIFDGLALDVIALAAFGVKTNAFKEKDDPFVQNVKGLFDTFYTTRIMTAMYMPQLLRTFKIRILQEKYCSYLRKVLNRETELRTNRTNDNQPTDLLDYLLKHFPVEKTEGGEICSLEILSHCVVFLMAGYETTSTGLSCAAHCLAFSPEHQDTAAEEIREALQGKDISWLESMDRTPFLSAVISETLRLYPAVPVLNRTATEDVQVGVGIHLKKGATVTVPISAMHRDPEYFQDPDTFNPLRFASSEEQPVPYSYLPFGAGPRNCLGMPFALLVMRLVLSAVLPRYKFVITPQTKKEVKMRVSSPVLFAEEVLLKIEKRS